MQIVIDNLDRPEIFNLLAEHQQNMLEHSPEQSVHALDSNALRAKNLTFWSAWNGQEHLGCGALKQLSSVAGELKSMRTASNHLRQGVADNLLKVIIAEAQARGYQQLYLETGSAEVFKPAWKLYESSGFEVCGPFADYLEDPFSVFMTKIL